MFLAILYNNIIVAQTIINYQTWTGASGCNIFSSAVNVPATINGSNGTIAHRSNIGQPTYSTAVVLDCNAELDVNGNTIGYKGTEYRLTYNFKQGYSYKITINAACVNSGTSSYASLRLLPNSGGSSTSTQCNGADNIDPNPSGNLYMSKTMTSTYSDWVYDYGLFASAQSLLDVAAVPPIGSGFQTITIRKITIEEIAPPVSFTLAPASLAITCGSATPQTFTVTNVHSTPGVTAYNWSLGAANGWIYNGSPAPATIQTSVNTLTLTPACQATHSGVSVSVTAGGSSYPADNVSAVTATTPVYSISGSSGICSGSQTYTVNNLPCNATVSWVSSNPGIAPVTVSNNVATVTRQGTYDDFVNLTATITSSMCHASPVIVQRKNIAVGFPYFTDTIVGGKRVLPTGMYFYSLILPLKYPPVSYYWRIPSGWTLMQGQGTNTIKVEAGSSPGNIQVDVTACGVTRGTYAYVAIGGGGPIPPFAGPGTEYSLKIFPNPAHTSATITLNMDNPEAKSSGYTIQEIKITDKTGMLRKHYRLNNGRTSETIDISGLLPDVYTVSVYDGQNWKQARLSVQ